MSGVPLLPLSARPVFARKLLAVWRLHHLDKGVDLRITIHPSEWPADSPRVVLDAEVVEDEIGPDMMLVMGRVRDSWRWCMNIASDMYSGMTVDDLATCTFFGEIHDEDGLRMWLAPDPETGDVPMWARRKGRP